MFRNSWISLLELLVSLFFAKIDLFALELLQQIPNYLLYQSLISIKNLYAVIKDNVMLFVIVIVMLVFTKRTKNIPFLFSLNTSEFQMYLIEDRISYLDCLFKSI